VGSFKNDIGQLLKALVDIEDVKISKNEVEKYKLIDKID